MRLIDWLAAAVLLGMLTRVLPVDLGMMLAAGVLGAMIAEWRRGDG